MYQHVKLEAAIRWKLRESFSRLGPINNRAVRSVFQEFNNNLHRVWSFATLLPKMMSLGDRYARAAERVALQATDIERSTPDFTKISQERIHKLVDEEEAEINADKAAGMDEDRRILKNIEFILGLYGQPKDDGSLHELLADFDLLFQSILINAWSAFEIFAEDLWIAALDNDESHKFAESFCSCLGSQSKSFSFDQLKDAQFNFDISKKLGSLLSKSEKAKFDSFSSISENYKKAFGKVQHDKRFEEIMRLTKADAANMLVLESVRNLLMHRGQMVDSKFIEQIKKATGCPLPAIKRLAENDKFMADGEIVKVLLESMVSLAVDLTRLVDEALTSVAG